MRNFLYIILGLLVFTLDATAQEGEKGLGRKSTDYDSTRGKRYALVIGVSNYESIKPLFYAHTDALRFANLLESGFLGKFEEIKVLIESNAKYTSITSAVFLWLSELTGEIRPNDEIYIYFSGHGMVNVSGQNLLPIDTRFVDGNLVTLQKTFLLSSIRDVVKPLVGANGAKVFYLIDACRENDEKTRNQLTAAKLSSLLIEPGEYFLFGTSDDLFSYETDYLDKGNGLFTYFLVLGLKGAADVNPADNRVSIGELKQFLEENVEQYSTRKLKKDPLQYPFINFTNMSAKNKVILASVPPDTVAKYKKAYADLRSSYVRRSPVGEAYIAARRFEPLQAPFRASQPGREAIPVYLFTDTVDQQVYGDFLAAIASRKLVEPGGKSAYDHYLKLEKSSLSGDILKSIRNNLFSALISKAQDFIDEYIGGRLRDKSARSFDITHRELSVAKTLIRPNNPYQEILRPKIYFTKARALAGSANPRDWDLGLQIIDSALAIDPGAAYSYFTRGILFASKHRFSSAISNFEKSNEFAPGWTYVLHNMAEAYHYLSEYDRSIDLSKLVMAKDSTYADAYALAARNYASLKMFDSAAFFSRRALALDSTHGQARIQLAEALFRQPDYSGEHGRHARYLLHQGASQFKEPESMILLAKLLAERNEADSARHYFELAIQTDPFKVEAIEQYAMMLQRENRMEKANALYRDAFQRMGEDSRLMESNISFLMAGKSYDSAQRRFDRLVALNHEDPSFFIKYSRKLEDARFLDRARTVLHQGLGFIPRSPSLLFNLAEFHFRNQQLSAHSLDSALLYFTRVLQITPEHSFTHFGIYQAKLSLGLFDEAITSLRLARKYNKYIESITRFNPDFILLGDRALGRKQYTEAIRFFELARARSNDFERNRKLALAYLVSGQTDRAGLLADSLSQFRLTSTQQRARVYLQAQVLFEKAAYREAWELFKTVDAQSPLPNYYEQAACAFMLNEAGLAAKLQADGDRNDPRAFEQFITNEGIRYTQNFIRTILQMKKN